MILLLRIFTFYSAIRDGNNQNVKQKDNGLNKLHIHATKSCLTNKTMANKYMCMNVESHLHMLMEKVNTLHTTLDQLCLGIL